MPFTTSKIWATRIGARPIDGSSSSRHDGRPISARAMASICCWPPERPPAARLRFSFRIGNMAKAFAMSFSTRSSV